MDNQITEMQPFLAAAIKANGGSIVIPSRLVLECIENGEAITIFTENEDVVMTLGEINE